MAKDKCIEKACRVGGLAFGDDDQLVATRARQIVESRAGEADVTRAGQEPGRRAVAIDRAR